MRPASVTFSSSARPARPATRCSPCSSADCGIDPGDELRIAAEEQRKITQLRLKKLLEAERDTRMITTHVLDIARGVPAVGVTVILELRQASEWAPIGRGITDENGRVKTLTPKGRSRRAPTA